MMHMIMKIIIVQISDSMIQLQKMMHMIMNIMIIHLSGRVI